MKCYTLFMLQHGTCSHHTKIHNSNWLTSRGACGIYMQTRSNHPCFYHPNEVLPSTPSQQSQSPYRRLTRLITWCWMLSRCSISREFSRLFATILQSSFPIEQGENPNAAIVFNRAAFSGNTGEKNKLSNELLSFLDRLRFRSPGDR